MNLFIYNNIPKYNQKLSSYLQKISTREILYHMVFEYLLFLLKMSLRNFFLKDVVPIVPFFVTSDAVPNFWKKTVFIQEINIFNYSNNC